MTDWSRKVADPADLSTSELVLLLHPDTCAAALFGPNDEHAPDSEREYRDEVANAMAKAAAELDRRVPVPKKAEVRHDE